MADERELTLDDSEQRRAVEVRQRIREAMDRANSKGMYDFAWSNYSDERRVEIARQAEAAFEGACADYVKTGRGLEAMQTGWKALLESVRIL